ncbi:MAG: hypothetical protein NTZ80_02090 [Patescibacteria group bacterium]|nr:hypothetical protein [Patescibacteria group bacterium]
MNELKSLLAQAAKIARDGSYHQSVSTMIDNAIEALNKKRLFLCANPFRFNEEVTSSWREENLCLNFQDGTKRLMPVRVCRSKSGNFLASQYLKMPKEYEALEGEQIIAYCQLPLEMKAQIVGLPTDREIAEIFAWIAGASDKGGSYTSKEQYEKLQQAINPPLAGCWNPNEGEFYCVGERASLITAPLDSDYTYAWVFDSESRKIYWNRYLSGSYGFSALLLS